ncbi:MAG: HlyD family secretion protein [Gemmataceae bacterium]
MTRKWMLPVLALTLFSFAVYQVVMAQQKGPKVTPPVQPAQTPFSKTVAGAGIIEPQTENIAIGTHLPGIVAEVFVGKGEKVPAGAPLFHLDDRHLQAQLRVRQANLESARAQLARLEQLPRPEEVPPSAAKVREAQALVTEQEDLLKRSQQLYAQRAIGEEELVRRRQAYQTAREQLARAQAEHDLLKAGAWYADKLVAQAAVAEAAAQLAEIEMELERLTVRAPMAGEVLQINVRPGEYVGTPPGQALIVLGNLSQLHVRVDIDEHDIPRYRPGASGKAMLRGNPRQEYLLSFVKVEPYVIPKKSLTGDNTERVDTRVLQVIYAIDNPDESLYVGQQMDVFLEAR